MIQDKQLLDDFHALPADKQAEVIDFIGYLKSKVQKNDAEKMSQLQTELKSSAEANNDKPLRKFGGMKGLVVYMADDFNEPLDDFAEYM